MRDGHGIEAEGFGRLPSLPLFVGRPLQASRNKPLTTAWPVSVTFSGGLAVEWRDGMRCIWGSGALCSLSISFAHATKILDHGLGPSLYHKDPSWNWRSDGVEVVQLEGSIPTPNRSSIVRRDLNSVVICTPSGTQTKVPDQGDSLHIMNVRL